MSDIVSFEIDSDSPVLNGKFLHIKDIAFDLNSSDSSEEDPKYGMKYSYFITDSGGKTVPEIEVHLKNNPVDRDYINESVRVYVEEFIRSKIDENVSAVSSVTTTSNNT